MPHARLPHFFSSFARDERGVAFITFGMFLALFAIGLLGLELSMGATHASHEEKVSKLNEYSTFLAKEYGALWKARALCETAGQSANCLQNGDASGRVFTRPFVEYGALGNGTGGDEVAMQDMAHYIQTSFNNSADNVAGFRFKDIIGQSVTRECQHDRILLRFTIQANQYSWFVKNDRDINVRVARLTDIPCDVSKVTPQPHASPYAPPAPGKSACAHGGPHFDQYPNPATSVVDLATVRSLVNFVISTDADSKALLGETGGDFTARFGSSLRGLANGVGYRDGTMASAVTIGNFPVSGGGAPACTRNGSGLVTSAGCFDNASTFDFKNGVQNAGIDNGSRKGDADNTVLTGEMRAQYTRHCPASQAVWTYKTVNRGDCVEHAYVKYTPDTGTYYGYAYRSKYNDTAFRAQEVSDFNANKQPQIQAICSQPNFVNSLPATMDQNASEVVDDSNCGATRLGDPCIKYNFYINCIKDKTDDKTVFGGEWSPACRSQQLGTTADQIYTSPDQLVRFRGKLIADLYNKPYKSQTLEVVATPVTAAHPDTMRAVDADLLRQLDELQELHVKNTERSFLWACDSGPRDAANNLVDNAGNLSAAYGLRTGDVNRSLLDNSGTVRTDTAKNANGGRNGGCTLPALASNGGKMGGTLATYDLNFKRDKCTGPLCDIPEGLYAITMEPGARHLEKNGQPPQSRFPAGGLATSWKSPAGAAGDLWAWDAFDGGVHLGNVPSNGGHGEECPRNRDDNVSCTNGWLTATDGKRYCEGYQYDKVQTEPVCANGGCQNIAEYILQGSDTVNNWPAEAQEHLNIGAVAMERRLIEVNGEQTPYTCMLDKGETTTGQRASQVYVADNGTLNCNWIGGSPFFCQRNSTVGSDSVTPDQAEERFIDSGDGGIFSLTADSFNAPIAIGDDKEEFRGSRRGMDNFRTRKVLEGSVRSEVDPGLTIMPVPVQAEETVHFRNSDDSLINQPMTAADKLSFDLRLQMLAEGYKGYDIFPSHRGNQCALFKQGVRLLNSGDVDHNGKEGSKFAVYVGALPTNDAYTAALAPHAAGQVTGSGTPGDYDASGLHMRSQATKPDHGADASIAFVHDCIGSIPEVSSTTTPFIVTTLPKGATNARAVLDAMKAATEATTNETCKRPYCLLSEREKDGSAWGLGMDEDNILTPETCAAKLWKCVTPAETK